MKWKPVVVGISVLLSALFVGGWVHGGLLLDTSDGFRETPPTAGFEYSYDSERSTLTVTHSGGSEFTPATTRRLEVYVTDGGAPNVTELDSNVTVSLPFEIGDTVTVSNVERGDTVFLVWWNDGKSDGDSAIVEKYVVGETDAS